MKSRYGQNSETPRGSFFSEPKITVRLCRPFGSYPDGHFYSAEISPVKLEHFYGEFCFLAKQKSAKAKVANNYWSSSTYVPNTTNAWNVNFNDGSVNNNNKTNSNYVRCVSTGAWS